jgi:hypothetical protein
MDGLLYPRRQSPQLLPAGAFELDRTHPLAAGLVGLWVGADPRDYSLSGNHGTVGGSPLPTTNITPAGPAWSFAGSGTSRIALPSTNSLSLTTVGSMFSLFQTTASSGQGILLGGYHATTPYQGYGLAIHYPTANQLGAYVSSGSGSYGGNGAGWTASATTVNDGRLHLTGATFGTLNVHVYDQGILTATSTAPTIPTYVALRCIGAAQNFSSVFNGAISGTWIWSRVLSSAEVARLYAEPFAMLRPVSRRLYYSIIATAAFGRGSAASFNKASAVGTVPLFG